MPWTFAHPAVVLPLRRLCPRYLSFPALIVGSMTPDFGYYISGADFATDAHSFEGIVWNCLPAGMLVLCLLYVLRRPLCFVLPQPHRTALTGFVDTPTLANGPTLLRMAISVMLGAATHIVWDAFTHKRDLMGLQLDWLQTPLFHLGATVVPLYYLLQWLSTLGGTAVLMIAYRSWLRRVSNGASDAEATREDRWRHRLLAAITIAALIVAVPLALEVAVQFTGSFSAAVFIRCIAVFIVVAFCVLLIATSLACYVCRQYGFAGPQPR